MQYTANKSRKIEVLEWGEIMELVKMIIELGEDEAFDFYENMLSALADKIRLKILNEISKSPNKNLCVCGLEEKFGLQQSKLSYNLKKLGDAIILKAGPHSTWDCYQI